MRSITITKYIEEMCIKDKAWAVYLSFSDKITTDDLVAAAKVLNLEKSIDIQIWANGYGIIMCDSEEEAYKAFNLTVGDNGPTESNDYCGIDRVYALVIGPEGMETSNT